MEKPSIIIEKPAIMETFAIIMETPAIILKKPAIMEHAIMQEHARMYFYQWKSVIVPFARHIHTPFALINR
jgi:hypothetical protein